MDDYYFMFSDASLEAPVVARVRQVLTSMSLVGGIEVSYSDWSDFFPLPYDPDCELPSAQDWTLQVHPSYVGCSFALGTKPNPVCVFGDYTLLSSARLGDYAGTLVSGSENPYKWYRLACRSSDGYSPFFAARYSLTLPELDFNQSTQKISFTVSDEWFDAYDGEENLLVSFCLYNPDSFTTYETLESFEYSGAESVSFSFPEEITAADQYVIRFSLSSVSTVCTYCTLDSHILTQSDFSDASTPIPPTDPIDPNPGVSDPDNPDNPSQDAPTDGSGLFESIDALGEPWNILIYIGGGCLIILALSAIFGRR